MAQKLPLSATTAVYPEIAAAQPQVQFSSCNALLDKLNPAVASILPYHGYYHPWLLSYKQKTFQLRHRDGSERLQPEPDRPTDFVTLDRSRQELAETRP